MTGSEEDQADPSVAPCAILHDAGRETWLQFDGPVEVVTAGHADEVPAALDLVETSVRNDRRCAAGWVAYEAASAFDPALEVHGGDDFPLVWFALFERVRPVCLRPPRADTRQPHWTPSVDEAAYALALRRIKDAIRAGETYQVNYTYRLLGAAPADPWNEFLRLTAAQYPSYGGYLDSGRWVCCSASPELFFEQQGDGIASRPMKGTAPRGRTAAEDAVLRERLLASEKDRAEHLMIVDMVRNDLGRIARTGSVEAPALLTAEAYPTLWQLTSTLRARTDASLTETFAALFPPASITGAPKASTMSWIRRLETTPRRVYTGAIGFLLPEQRTQFNVAIRTLLCDRQQGTARYGVGGGIVWDSQIAAERREAELKARILTAPSPRVELLETLLWTSGAGYALLGAHLRRLQRAADFFGHTLDLARIHAALIAAARGLQGARSRVRLRVDPDGTPRIDTAPIEAGTGFADPVLDSVPTDTRTPFVRYKTGCREVYAGALARHPGAADVLLHNHRGEMTESTLANLVYRRDGVLWTPPLRAGLLPGTFRDWLLACGRVRERPLPLDELSRVEALYLANAVRGLHRIRLRTGRDPVEPRNVEGMGRTGWLGLSGQDATPRSPRLRREHTRGVTSWGRSEYDHGDDYGSRGERRPHRAP